MTIRVAFLSVLGRRDAERRGLRVFVGGSHSWRPGKPFLTPRVGIGPQGSVRSEARLATGPWGLWGRGWGSSC